MEFCLCLDLNWTDRGSWLDNWDYLLSLTINYGLSHAQHRPTGQRWGWSLLVEKRISWEWRRWHVPHCNVWWTRPETVSKHEIASEILSILGLRCFYSDFRSNVTQRRVRSNADQGKHKESSSHWHSSVTLYYYCCCEGRGRELHCAHQHETIKLETLSSWRKYRLFLNLKVNFVLNLSHWEAVTCYDRVTMALVSFTSPITSSGQACVSSDAVTQFIITRMSWCFKRLCLLFNPSR